MKFIIKPPRCGKTTELIKLALEKDAYIIVIDQKMKEILLEKAKQFGIDNIKCFSRKDIKEKRHIGLKIKYFIIDDIEWIIQDLFPRAEVIAVAGTWEAE
jgi:hypothetical protein